MKLIVDNREQRPLDFSKYPCEIETGTLYVGDYALVGLERYAAIERKSLDDLVSSLSTGRDRFERELQRGAGLELFSVVIEASMQDVRDHAYRSKMAPHAVLQSCLAFQIRYKTPFVWCGSPEGAAYTVFWTLQKYLREVESKLKAVVAQVS